MSLTRLSVVNVVGALALVAVLPAAALAQSPNSNSSSPAPTASSAPAPKAVQPPAPYRWSGVYFGGFIGDAWANTDVSASTISVSNGYAAFTPGNVSSIADEGAQNLRTNEVIYGGEAGYDFQVARLLFGGAFDFSVMNMKDFVSSGTNYTSSASTFAITQAFDTNYLMTARARVGWITGRRLLIFGTAGIAWVNLKYEAQFSDNFAAAEESGDFDELVNGWVYGAGAEYRLTRNLSVKGEYLYTAFDDVTSTSTNLSTTIGNFPQNVFTHTTSFNLNVVKGSFKFRF